MSTDRLSLKDAADYLGIKPHSLRTALRKGRIEAAKYPHPTMPKIERWEIEIEALDEYRATAGSVGTRPDGRNKFVIYLESEDELPRAREALLAAGFDNPSLPVRANPPKS